MRRALIALALAGCNIPDAHFFKGDGGSDGGGVGSGCKLEVGFPGVPWPVIGPGLTAMALGDVTGDGIADLVVAAGVPDDYKMHILVGTATGRFYESSTAHLDAAATAIVIAQVDSDGLPDVVTANRANHTVSVLYNTNDLNVLHDAMSFQLGAGAGPVAVAVAQLDGDMQADLVVADADQGKIHVLASTGPRAYADMVPPYDVGPNPTAVAIADLDGDGHLDAIVTTANVGASPGTAYVLAGDATGKLTAAKMIGPVGKAPSALAVVDLNNDNRPDLVVTNAGDGTVTRLYNRGGSFDASADIAIPAPAGVAIGTVDTDAELDLVVSSATGVYVVRGQGKEQFAAPVATFVGGMPGDVAIAHFGGGSESAPETVIAVANRSDGTVAVWRARADGSLIAPAANAVGAVPIAAIAAPLHGGTALDVVTADAAAGTVSVLRNAGGGAFAAPVAVAVAVSDMPSTAEVYALAAADVDGDGALDVLVTDTALDELHVLTNDGHGVLTRAAGFPLGQSASAIAVGQFGPGMPGVVVAMPGGHAVAVLRLPTAPGGGLTRLTDVAFGTGDPIEVALADLNGDGFADLVIADVLTKQLELRLGQGDGSFAAVGTTRSLPGIPTGLAVAALSIAPGSLPDIVVTVAAPDQLMVFHNLGGGSFEADATAIAIGSAPQTPVIADLDRDGNPDIAYAVHGGTTVGVLAGAGDGQLLSEIDYGVGASPNRFVAADVTGDGALDLVVPYGSNGLDVLAATCVLP